MCLKHKKSQWKIIWRFYFIEFVQCTYLLWFCRIHKLRKQIRFMFNADARMVFFPPKWSEKLASSCDECNEQRVWQYQDYKAACAHAWLLPRRKKLFVFVTSHLDTPISTPLMSDELSLIFSAVLPVASVPEWCLDGLLHLLCTLSIKITEIITYLLRKK